MPVPAPWWWGPHAAMQGPGLNNASATREGEEKKTYRTIIAIYRQTDRQAELDNIWYN